jgi:tRNA dimethylallyltransferase
MSREPDRPILIAGPTASGKSALALRLAQERGGLIVNADAMQVYRELSVLTARPGPDDEAAAPHALYGHVPAAEPYSVARWLDDVLDALGAAKAKRLLPIIVGGTGLYFKALLEGLSPMPAIPAEVRRHWREVAATAAPGVLHRMLGERDELMAARLAPADTQRLTRALEVIEATGRSLADWQALPGEALLRREAVERLVVRVPREALHRRCDRRFDRMIALGALDEVRALGRLGLDGDRPVMRALGVAPLAAHLAGELSLADAVTRAKAETRQYVKRQETWLRRHMADWEPVEGDAG